MQIIRISRLRVSETRQRKEFSDDKITELAQSIRSSKGLMHPIVVRELPNDQGYELVAGERRLRAIQTLQLLNETFSCNQSLIEPGFVPVTLLHNLSPLELEEAELEENTLRVDLSLQEHAQAVARLHELRLAQRGNQTITATAEEIYGDAATQHSVTKISEQLIIAKHLDDPEVAKAKTHKEAIKIIEKKAQTAHRAELAKTFDLTKTPHQLAHASAFDFVPTLSDAVFDLVITDPPYGVGADTFGDMASTGHNYADDYAYARKCYEFVANESFRVTKPQAAVYAFCDIRYFSLWVELFAQAGWIVWERPLIWSKKNGMLPKPDYGPRNTYEAILFAYKADTKIVRPGQADVLSYALDSSIQHGAQKPAELYLELIQRSTNPGAQILDMFAGSGTVFVAANSASVRAVGCEINADNYALCLSRITKSCDDPLTIFDAVPPSPL